MAIALIKVELSQTSLDVLWLMVLCMILLSINCARIGKVILLLELLNFIEYDLSLS